MEGRIFEGKVRQGPLRAENSWEGLPKGRGNVLGGVEAGGVVVASEKRAKTNLRIFPACCSLSSNLAVGCLPRRRLKLLARTISAFRISCHVPTAAFPSMVCKARLCRWQQHSQDADRIGSR